MRPGSSIKSRNQYAPISEVSKRSTVRNHGKRRNENLRAGLVNGCETAQAARRFNVCVSPGKPGRKTSSSSPASAASAAQERAPWPRTSPAAVRSMVFVSWRCVQSGRKRRSSAYEVGMSAEHTEHTEHTEWLPLAAKCTAIAYFLPNSIGAAERTRTWANLTRMASVLGLDQAGFDAVLRETAERCQRYQAAELVRQACARF